MHKHIDEFLHGQHSEESTEFGENTDLSSRNTLRYIMLGLLWTHPMSGYDIKRAFEYAIAS